VYKIRVNRAFELLSEGSAALKAKDMDRAEELLLAAFQAYGSAVVAQRPTVLNPQSTVCVALGTLYRRTGRYEDAINVLERALPNPGAFADLVSIFRFLAKAAKKEGDLPSCSEWYRRMFCLATIFATVMTLRSPAVPVAVDWERAARWLDDIRGECGTLYAYQFDGQEIPGDGLLTAADYKALQSSRNQEL
jgi:tetratricopeptide (TPR) repeat protein